MITHKQLDWRWLAMIILILAASRLLPHPPNFTPIGAMAILAGAYIKDIRLGLFIMLFAMGLSDTLLGWHSSLVYVYAAIIAVVVMNRYLLNNSSNLKLAASTVASALVFFIISNFGAWLTHDMYAHTFNGLMQAYVAGLPFLKNTVASNVVFIALSMLPIRYLTKEKSATVNSAL
jgi:hypothetical protein